MLKKMPNSISQERLSSEENHGLHNRAKKYGIRGEFLTQSA